VIAWPGVVGEGEGVAGGARLDVVLEPVTFGADDPGGGGDCVGLIAIDEIDAVAFVGFGGPAGGAAAECGGRPGCAGMGDGIGM